MIRRLSTGDACFLATLDALLHFDHSTDDAIEQTVAEILKRVRSEGDVAVLDYTRRFDKLDAGTMAELELSRSELRLQDNDPKPPSVHHNRPSDLQGYRVFRRFMAHLSSIQDGTFLSGLLG